MNKVKKYERVEKVGNIDIFGFKVADYINQIEEFGNRYVSYKDENGEELFIQQKENKPEFTTINPAKDENIKLNCPQYRNITSWPMANENSDLKDLNKKNPKKRKGIISLDTVLKDHNLDEQIIRPQIIYLGLNCSGDQKGKPAYTSEKRERAQWNNGFGDMANVVRNSPISGGFFTDYIKCFKKTKSGEVHNKYNKEYIKIFENELDWLRQTFFNSEREEWEAFVIICGKTTFDKINGPELAEILKKDGFEKVQVMCFGLHYGKSAQTYFVNDKKNTDNSKIAKRLSCGRVYSSIKDRDSDYKNDKELYDFAIKINNDKTVYLKQKE